MDFIKDMLVVLLICGVVFVFYWGVLSAWLEPSAKPSGRKAAAVKPPAQSSGFSKSADSLYSPMDLGMGTTFYLYLDSLDDDDRR